MNSKTEFRFSISIKTSIFRAASVSRNSAKTKYLGAADIGHFGETSAARTHKRSCTSTGNAQAQLYFRMTNRGRLELATSPSPITIIVVKWLPCREGETGYRSRTDKRPKNECFLEIIHLKILTNSTANCPNDGSIFSPSEGGCKSIRHVNATKSYLHFCRRDDFVFQTVFSDCWKFKRKRKAE